MSSPTATPPARAAPPRPDGPEPAVAAPARRARTAVGVSALVLLCAGLVVATITVGSVAIPLGDVLAVFAGNAEDATAVIVSQVRLPRALTALLAGAALGVGGLQMQTLFRNPLADPYILGISAGASLGVAVAVLAAGSTGAAVATGFGATSGAGLAVAASVGAGAVTALVLLASRRVESPTTVLIIGLMVGYTVTAIVSVLVQGGLGDLDRLRAYVAWGFGSFAGTSWTDLRVLAVAVVGGLLLASVGIKALNALLLGDTYAETMGVRVRRVRLLVALSASLLAGAVTAYCGPIAFIGVAAPHLARGLLRTSDHRVLLPGSLLVGSAVALTAGLVALLPGQDAALPLNAVTALVGAPVVVGVLLRLRRSSKAVIT